MPEKKSLSERDICTKNVASTLKAKEGDFILSEVDARNHAFGIVPKVEKLLAICDQLESQITSNQTHAEQLMQAVLKEAFQQNSSESQREMMHE